MQNTLMELLRKKRIQIEKDEKEESKKETSSQSVGELLMMYVYTDSENQSTRPL